MAEQATRVRKSARYRFASHLQQVQISARYARLGFVSNQAVAARITTEAQPPLPSNSARNFDLSSGCRAGLTGDGAPSLPRHKDGLGHSRSNDVANAISSVAAIIGVVTTGEVTSKSAVPVWVLLIGAAGTLKPNGADAVYCDGELTGFAGERISKSKAPHNHIITD